MVITMRTIIFLYSGILLYDSALRNRNGLGGMESLGIGWISPSQKQAPDTTIDRILGHSLIIPFITMK